MGNAKISKNIVIILFSGLILFFSLKDFGYMFISIPVFLLLSYNFSDMILKLGKRKKTIEINKNIEYLFLIAIILFLMFGRYYENTIGGYELFWKLAFASLGFTILTIFHLNFFYDLNNPEKRNIILSICMFFFFLIPSLGILINQKFEVSEVKEKLEINRKYINNGAKGGKSYEIFIKTKFDEDERLSIGKEFYDSISNNQMIELTLSKGILGYNYVKKIEKYNSY